MSLRHLLRRSSVFRHLCPTTTTNRNPIPISSLHHRFYNISISPDTQDPETVSDNQDPETISDNQDAETKTNSNDPSQFQIPPNHTPPIPYPSIPRRTMAFSSPEEAAAERRRRKRRLRIEPPLNSPSAPTRDPSAPIRFPDLTSALVGQRLNLHNRVQSLIRASDLDAASRLARQSVFSNPRPTVFTCNAIIAAMYRAKRYGEAVSLFQYFFKQSNIIPNIVSYNQIIDAHCGEGHVEEAFEVYRYILANAPFTPSSVTYRYLTKGLVQAGRIGEAVSLLREMLSKGHAADSMVYNNLIKGFLDLGDLDKANELFDELKSRCTVYDGIVNATFMEYWFEKGNDKEAMESYCSLLDKKFRMHPSTGNVLLEVFLKYDKKTEAWALFNEMLDNHRPPNFLTVNPETFSIMVNECFKMGQFTKAIDTFNKVGSKPTCKPCVMDYVAYRNIVTRFCEQGMLTEAESFFTEGVNKGMPNDASSYRVMIDAYLKAERIDDALKMLNRMVDVNLRVVAYFGTRVFDKLIKNGKLTESAEVLTKMGEREPKPDPSIYDVVVRGLCDGGALDQAKDIIVEMVAHGVGVAPVLRDFVIETFEKAGRREEIEKTLNSVTRPFRNPGQSGNTPPSVPTVLNATLAAPQQPNKAPWTSHGAGLPSSGRANGTTGQTATRTYKANNDQNPSWSNTSVNQQQQSWSNQTAGQQPPSWSSQAPGYQPQQSWSQQPGWSGPTGHQQSWVNQTTGQQQTWPNQTPGQQQTWALPTQTPGQQQTWATQAPGQQQTWATPTHTPGQQQQTWENQQSLVNQTSDQHQRWAYQNTGHQQPWANQNTYSHPQAWANQNSSQQQPWTGTQQSWSNQTANHLQSEWSNPAPGRVASQAPWSNSTNGQHPQQQEPGSSHEWQDREDKNVAELRN